jgi:hypothetical protein
MSVDITKFAAAVQNLFERFGVCNIIDFTTDLECNKNNNSKYHYHNNNKYTTPYSVSVTVSPT